jgi:hypothetical protein
MLELGPSTNVMSLNVLNQLGLKIKFPYGNACDIDSKKVKVYGLKEDVEVYLLDFPHISLIMNCWKCLTGSICLSLMASTAMKMACIQEECTKDCWHVLQDDRQTKDKAQEA